MSFICQGLEPGLLKAEEHPSPVEVVLFGTRRGSTGHLIRFVINGKEMVEAKRKTTYIV